MSKDQPTGALKIIASLASICLLAGLTLGAAYIITRDQIAYQEEKEKQRALVELFGDKELSEEKFLETPEKDLVYWKAYINDEVQGYGIIGSEYGYSGQISFLVAVDPSMKILGVEILGQNETPGLGTRIAEVPVSRYIFGKKKEVETTRPWFLEQFVGLNPLELIRVKKVPEWHTLGKEKRQELKEDNSITTVTGATISSEAVADGVHKTVKLFQSHYSNTGSDE